MEEAAEAFPSQPAGEEEEEEEDSRKGEGVVVHSLLSREEEVEGHLQEEEVEEAVLPGRFHREAEEELAAVAAVAAANWSS